MTINDIRWYSSLKIKPINPLYIDDDIDKTLLGIRGYTANYDNIKQKIYSS